MTEALSRLVRDHKTLVIYLSTAALLLGFYFTLDALRRTHEAEIADRFTLAVEQLRQDRVEIRVGGIYALERIAVVSDKDYGIVVEILTTYVRERSAWKDTNTPVADQLLSKRAPDIQAVLSVLGRRARTYQDGEVERLNLARTDLRRANLGGANLAGAVLSGAHLEGANLSGARLKGTILRGTHLEQAGLQYADLREAFLGDARLDGASLKGANLEEAYLIGAHFEGANLLEADLRGVIGLTWDQIKTAFRDGGTRLPDYLRATRPLSRD